MYPVLILGQLLEPLAKRVRTQSTTRSPLLARENADYPIRTKLSFASVYDDERTTYLYNVAHYDTVMVITDAPAPQPGALLRALQQCGNPLIYFVRLAAQE